MPEIKIQIDCGSKYCGLCEWCQQEDRYCRIFHDYCNPGQFGKTPVRLAECKNAETSEA